MKPRVSTGNIRRLLLGEVAGDHKQRLPITGRNARRLAKKKAKKETK